MSREQVEEAIGKEKERQRLALEKQQGKKESSKPIPKDDTLEEAKRKYREEEHRQDDAVLEDW